MNLSSLLRAAAVVSFAVFAAACASEQPGDPGGNDGEGIGDDTTSSTGASNPTGGSGGSGSGLTYAAVAISYAALDAYDQSQISAGEGGTTVATGGVDTNRTFLQISNDGLTCSAPRGASGCDASAHWQVSIAVPNDQLVAGASYTLEQLNAFASITEATDDGGPDGTCSGGGGSFFDGNVSIDSVSDTFVVFTVSGSSGWQEISADGHYVAPRCY